MLRLDVHVVADVKTPFGAACVTPLPIGYASFFCSGSS